MLTSLTIQDIVLIERLHLDCGRGLTVMTGETGAGKSILLDSLGLALGNRADSALVRHGQDQGSVTAIFHLPKTHGVYEILKEQGLSADEDLFLRRVVTNDGRSRAFINDQPVSATLLRQVGEQLVEIHGQHDDRGLLDARGHRDLLDAYAGHDGLLAAVRDAYAALRDVQGALKKALSTQEEAKRDEDYLRHAMEELDKLNPQEGEEAELSERRALMQQGEAVAEGLNEVIQMLGVDGGPDAVLRGAIRRLEKLSARAGDLLEESLAALDRAAIEAGEALAKLEETQSQIDFDQSELERIEARLFDIRGLARKHSVLADDLPKLRADMAERLDAIDHGAERIEALEADVAAKRAAFERAVVALSKSREKYAATMGDAVNAELAPLKLEKARFKVVLEALQTEQWNGEGGERVAFEISTNPGAPFGPLIKIASGGELSRFILALKVVLADKSGARTMIFDEVDRGVGGATASAIGDRLARLAEAAQVLVVTHSPQVAARGQNHWRIEKHERTGATITHVAHLADGERREEIARMLSGAIITNEARAAADSLLIGTA